VDSCNLEAGLVRVVENFSVSNVSREGEGCSSRSPFVQIAEDSWHPRMFSSSQGFQTPASYSGTKGTLSFDGNNLMFSYTSGMFSKHQRVPINIPAKMISGATVEGSVFKKLVIRTNEKDTIPRYEFQVSAPHQWASHLSNAVHHLVREEQVIMKEVIREVKVLIRCSHCGFHSLQGTLSCPTCGGPL